MTIQYGPRINVHPDRQGADRSNATKPMVHFICGHTSEQSGAEDPNDAEDLGRYLTTPGDRPTSSGGTYGSSYHAITDTDRILPATQDHIVAYAAGGGNQYGLHICLPVKAGQTRDQWLDAGSRGYITRFAEYIVDKSNLYGLPIRRITIEQLRAGSWGYCDHNTVSKAYGKSDHTDLGPNFPWDVLAADIAKLTEPPPPDPTEPDMTALDTAERAFDSRPTEQGGVNPTLAWANGDIPKTPLAAGETRGIVIHAPTTGIPRCRQAFVQVTCIGRGNGFVSISGTPVRSFTSLVNYDNNDLLEANGAPVGTPEGKVYVTAFGGGCEFIVDVFARG